MRALWSFQRVLRRFTWSGMSHLVLELGACSEEGGRQVRFQMGYYRKEEGLGQGWKAGSWWLRCLDDLVEGQKGMSEYRFLSWISGWPSCIYWNEQWFAEKIHWTLHLGFEDPRRLSHILHQNTPALILSTPLCRALLEVCWYSPLPSLRCLYPYPLLRGHSSLPLISVFPCSVPLICWSAH